MSSNSQSKEKTGFWEWFWFISCICVIIFGVVGLIVIVYSNEKTEECLEPLAKQICGEKNLTYLDNNLFSFWCDEGRQENIKFNFHPDEIEECR